MKLSTITIITAGVAALCAIGWANRPEALAAEQQKAHEAAVVKIAAIKEECGGAYAAAMTNWRHQRNADSADDALNAKMHQWDREEGDNVTMTVLRAVADGKEFSQIQRQITREANEAGDDLISQTFQQDVVSCTWDAARRLSTNK